MYNIIMLTFSNIFISFVPSLRLPMADNIVLTRAGALGLRRKQFSSFPGHEKFMGYHCGLHNSLLGFTDP